MSESDDAAKAQPRDRELELKLHGKECPETDCDYVAETMDHLVDHITDEHDLYTWVSRGRPINE